MVGDGIVMTILFQVIIVYLLLLLITFAVPKLQPLLYAALFFFMFFIVLTTVVFPFSQTFIKLFDVLPNPYTSLLIGSAIFYVFAEIMASHIAEAGYASLAEIAHFSVKIAILFLWMDEIKKVVELLAALITT